MAEREPCEICGSKQAEHFPDPNIPGWSCPRCGEFDHDRSVPWRKITSPDEMVRLSGWVREQNAAGLKPVRIAPEVWARVPQIRPPSFRERALRVLSVIARVYARNLNAPFVPDTEKYNLELQGVSYSRDGQELLILFEILIEEGFLHSAGAMCTLSVNGLLAAEALGASKSGALKCFVAMWFDPSLQDVWINGFDPGIRAAGFRPVRIDKEDYIGSISDEVMAEIRRSRFVVADYTGQNNGVYFEAGFALGLGLTVIPTCRADEVPKLHFDIKHLNTLLWNTPAELADILNRRIRAVIGAGPDASDPA
jgi:hypothetical protein